MNQKRLALHSGRDHLRFFELSSRLAALAANEGLELRAFDDERLPHFSVLDDSAREDVLRRMSDYVVACEHTARSGFSIRDARALTWRMMKHLGLTPLSDVFDRIGPKDFVEIYNERHVQCFASFNFLNEVTYSLEDLYCRPWIDLYSREDEVSQKIFTSLQELLSCEQNRTICPEIPAHHVRETHSVGRRSAIIKPKLFSPVQERGRRAGFMTVNEVLTFDPA